MNIFYPLEIFSRWVTYQVFSVPENSLLGNALEFFILDTLKIFIMLFVLIFIVSLLRSFISKERIQKFLTYKKRYVGHVIASLFGVITPFCSCSAIPLFLSLLEVGVPIGIAFTFLIASPLINEVALILLLSLFGIKIALIYVTSGLLISIFAGIILGKFKADKWILKDILIKDSLNNKKCSCQKNLSWKERLLNSKRYTLIIIKKIWLYVLLGVGVGAWIHGYVPDNFLAKFANAAKWYDVPFAVLIGVPLYSNAAGIIPLISSLIEKGLSMGTALAFMMAVTGLSLPEFLILKRIMKWKLIFIFAGIVAIGIILVGYLFNLILFFK
jgi:uncharacterized protein